MSNNINYKYFIIYLKCKISYIIKIKINTKIKNYKYIIIY